jgi:hypothetical protein
MPTFARMFNLFKKKKYIQSWEYELLHGVVSALPNKYSYLTKQVAPESLIDVVDHTARKNGWKKTKYSPAAYQQYLNESPKLNGLLVGIKVFDLTDQNYKEVELDLYDGALLGCRYPVGKYDLTRIDVSGLRFKPHQSEENIKYKAALKDLKCTHLDLDNGFEIELSGKTYYTIKDLEDGNYLAINTKGNVYGLFHDPFIVEQISSDLATFIAQIDNGSFSIEEYYNSKFV